MPALSVTLVETVVQVVQAAVVGKFRLATTSEPSTSTRDGRSPTVA